MSRRPRIRRRSAHGAGRHEDGGLVVRRHEAIIKILAFFTGFLISDGYEAYPKLLPQLAGLPALRRGRGLRHHPQPAAGLGRRQHPGYVLGCWLREHQEQVWLFICACGVD